MKKVHLFIVYCPLVEAWSSLTDDEEKISKLCDIAMDGDRGIISRFPDFQLEIEKTIAEGDNVCRLNITRTCRGSPTAPSGEESASFRSSTQLRV